MADDAWSYCADPGEVSDQGMGEGLLFAESLSGSLLPTVSAMAACGRGEGGEGGASSGFAIPMFQRSGSAMSAELNGSVVSEGWNVEVPNTTPSYPCCVPFYCRSFFTIFIYLLFCCMQRIKSTCIADPFLSSLFGWCTSQELDQFNFEMSFGEATFGPNPMAYPME
jgi:hypothetical protein